MRKSHIEPYFYLSGQIIAFLAVVGFFGLSVYEGLKEERDFGKMKDNHRAVGLNEVNPLDTVTNTQHIRTAFLRLEASFADPNSFELTRMISVGNDTVVNSISDTSYTILFTYLHQKTRIVFEGLRI